MRPIIWGAVLCALASGCAGMKEQAGTVADLPSPAETIAAWRPAKPAIFVKPGRTQAKEADHLAGGR
jgi:hypothetical protein